MPLRCLSSIFTIAVIIIASLPAAVAQDDEDYIVFARSGALYAQAISTGEVSQLGPTSTDFAAIIPGYDAYTLATAPIAALSRDGYGFWHGVWSPDRDKFVYLEVAPSQYRVRLHILGGDNQLLLEGQSNEPRGLLDPIGWTAEGEVILLERQLLNYLHTVKVWRLDPTTLSLALDTFVPIERLSGRTALLPDSATVFLGFNLEQHIGFLLDVPSGETRIFATQLGQTTLPPTKGFEYYPLQVFGALTENKLGNLTERIQSSNAAVESSTQPAPFLHWPLPDEARSITCYPDAVWTTTNFDVTCPGLSSPRNYLGHEGTDIGGKPDGLTLGTPVYPAAPGVVVATYRDCVGENPSCNDSYGNTVTLEHILIDNGQAQIWYTGYGHLQTVLVESSTYLTDVTKPLGLSGATGVGGAHLHFEVRSTESWVDPWDNRAGQSLWLGSNARPQAAVDGIRVGEDSEVLAICTSAAENNIRSGPGTMHDIVGKTAQDIHYSVLEVTFVDSGEAQGDWYRVRFEGGEGWLWFGLLDCT